MPANREVIHPNYTNSLRLTAPTYWHMFVTSLRVLRHCILIGVAIEPRIGYDLASTPTTQPQFTCRHCVYGRRTLRVCVERHPPPPLSGGMIGTGDVMIYQLVKGMLVSNVLNIDNVIRCATRLITRGYPLGVNKFLTIN